MSFTSADEVLSYIRENDVQFVDVRFCDLPGIMQHFTVPGSNFGADVFDGRPDVRRLVDPRLPGDPRVGHAAAAGPDDGRASTRSAQHKTLNMNFFIHDPLTGEAYSRDPRNIARKAEAVPQGHRHRRHRLLRPRGRVLHLRRRPLRPPAERELLPRRLDRGRVEHRPRRRPAATSATSRATRAATSRSRRPTTSPTCARRWSRCSSTTGIDVEMQHHEVGTAGQAEIDFRFGTAAEDRRQPDDCSSTSSRTSPARAGKTVTFMPKPLFGDNGSGMHCHQSLWKDGAPLFYDEVGYAGPVGHRPLLHRRPAQARPVAAGLHQPDDELLPPPGARLRGAGQPGLLAAQPLGLLPHPDHRLATRRPSASSSACPTRRATRTSRSRRC